MPARTDVGTFWSRLSWWCLLGFVLTMPCRVLVGPAHLNLEWSDLAALGFLVCSLLAGVWRASDGPRVPWWAVGYLGSLLPSVANAVHRVDAWLELAKTIYLIVLGVAVMRWLRVESSWDRLARLVAGVTGVMLAAVIGIWVYTALRGAPPGHLALIMPVPNMGQAVIRVQATFFTPTMLANFLTIGAPVLLGYVGARAQTSRARSWALLVVVMAAAASTVSNSLAGCLVALAIMAPNRTRGDRRGRLAVAVAAGLVIMLSLLSTTLVVQDVQLTHREAPEAVALPSFAWGPGNRAQEVVMRGVYVWVSYGLLKHLAWKLWQMHPWVGMGPGGFPHAVAEAFDSGRMHTRWADPHSTWFGSLAESGLAGTVGLAGLWIAVLRGASRRQRQLDWRLRAPFAGLVGVLVNSLHVDVMHFRFLWLGIALLLARTHTRSSPNVRHPSILPTA